MAQVALSAYGVYQRWWICWHPPVPLNASIVITPWKHFTTCGGLRVECLQPSFESFRLSYVFPPPALVPLVLSKFLTEHVTGQCLRLLILVALMLDGGSLAFQSSHHVSLDIPQQCAVIKDLIMDVFVGHVSSRVCHICT